MWSCPSTEATGPELPAAEAVWQAIEAINSRYRQRPTAAESQHRLLQEIRPQLIIFVEIVGVKYDKAVECLIRMRMLPSLRFH